MAGPPEARDHLGARAQEPGIPAGATHATKRPRPDPTSVAKLAAGDLIKQHKLSEAIKQAGGDPEASEETAARACC